MASFDNEIAKSLQELAAIGIGDISNLAAIGLPAPWGLIATSTGTRIQAFTGIGNLIGDSNQIVLVLGSQWGAFLNAVSLHGFPYLLQTEVSQSILSGTSGVALWVDTVNRILSEARTLSRWAESDCGPESQILEGLRVPEASAQTTGSVPTFNGPLQTLYLSAREQFWAMLEQASKLVTSPADTELLICGQGIGAAMAQLAAYDFRPDKPETTLKFKNIKLYTYSTPLNANDKFQSLFNSSLNDAWAVNAGTSPVVDFFPSEPTVDNQGRPLVQLGTTQTVAAPLPEFDAPWWERSGPFYTDVLSNTTTQPDASGANTGAAPSFDALVAYTLAQLCAGAAQRAQHPELSPKLPSSWSLVKAFPEEKPILSVFHRPSPNSYAVVFRSGISFAETMDIMANFSPTTIGWIEPNTSAHGGAYLSYTDIRDDLRAYLKTLDWNNASLQISGHSLGAMMAMICAVDLDQNPIDNAPEAHAYCFGSPAAAGYSLSAALPELAKSVFLVGRSQDTIAKVNWNSILTSYGTDVKLGGTTKFDGPTFHPINAYIALLDPSQSEGS